MGWPKDSRASEWQRDGLTDSGYEGQPRASSFDLEAGVSQTPSMSYPGCHQNVPHLGPLLGSLGCRALGPTCTLGVGTQAWRLSQTSTVCSWQESTPLHSGTLRPGWRFGHWWLLLGQVIGQTRMGTWSRPHWAHPSCPGGAGGTESEVPSVSQGGKTCS